MAEKAPKQKVNLKASGNSGIAYDSGVFDEEYLEELKGPGKHQIYDKMLRGDSQVVMLLNAVKSIITGAKFTVDGEDEKQNEIVQNAIDRGFGKGSFKKFVEESLTVLEHGFVMFERVHKNLDTENIGNITTTELKFRSQKSIEEWDIDEQDEKLISVKQTKSSGGTNIIPAEFLTIFNVKSIGINYEGISFLRPCYGPYKRKLMKLLIEALGLEKYSTPLAVASVPDDEPDDNISEFKEILEQYAKGKSNYILKYDKYNFEVHANQFDASKIQPSIDAEDKRMTKAFLANFLELGTNSSSGSFALSQDLSDFFLASVEYIIDGILETLNEEVIKELIRFNIPNPKEYSKITRSSIRDKAGKEIAEVIKALTESGVIIPDDELEKSVRSKYNLPEKDESTQRIKSEVVGEEVDNKEKAEKLSKNYQTINFANEKKYKTQRAIKSHTKKVHLTLKKELKKYTQEFIKKAKKEYKLADDKLEVVEKLEGFRSKSFEKALEMDFDKLAMDGLSIAISEIEGEKSNFKKKKSYKKEIERRVKMQARRTAESKSKEFEELLIFQFIAGVEREGALDTILLKIDEKANEKISSGKLETTAKTVTAKVINDTKRSYFFSEEVLSEIESFTFVNPEPDSDICKNLSGRTVKPNDPDLIDNWTPLHHNCDSTWLPNLKGDSSNPKAKDSAKPKDELLKQKTL